MRFSYIECRLYKNQIGDPVDRVKAARLQERHPVGEDCEELSTGKSRQSLSNRIPCNNVSGMFSVNWCNAIFPPDPLPLRLRSTILLRVFCLLIVILF